MFSVWAGSGDIVCLNTILIMARKEKRDVFKSDLSMDSLIIKANIIHDKLNLWHQENKVRVHIIRYFCLK